MIVSGVLGPTLAISSEIFVDVQHQARACRGLGVFTAWAGWGQ
jgi:hypothetical protein